MNNYNEILKYVLTLPERIDKKKGITYSRAAYWRENWDKDCYLHYIYDTGAPYQKIVAKFLELKKTPIENYDQIGFFFQRNQRTASEMVGFSLEKIEKTYKYLESKMDSYRIALETVGKYLEENIEVLEHGKEEPIITLSNGERIYSIQRLKELEKDNKISWDGRRWLEK